MPNIHHLPTLMEYMKERLDWSPLGTMVHFRKPDGRLEEPMTLESAVNSLYDRGGANASIIIMKDGEGRHYSTVSVYLYSTDGLTNDSLLCHIATPTERQIAKIKARAKELLAEG